METTTYDTPGELHLEIRIPAGSIRIQAEDTTQTVVKVQGEQDPENLRVDLEDRHATGHRLTIEHRERGKRFGRRGGETRLDLVVPLGTHAVCETGSADLRATGRLGSLTFRSGSGDCGFDHVDGDVTVKTASGDLAGASVGGGAVFTSASGDVRLREVTGDVVGKSASGDFALGNLGGSTRLATVSGDVEIGAVARGSTSIRSVSGDVEIGVARGIRVLLDVGSTSGDTACDLDMSDATAGGGDPDLELAVWTVSGDIRITRSSADASAGHRAAG